MKHYLIYQDSSVDEGSRTIIVGPFARREDRTVIRRSHELNSGGGWAVGPWDYGYAGEIDGEVFGFPIESPYELLDRYVRDEEGVAKVKACAALIEEKGFPPPDWVRDLAPKPPAKWACDPMPGIRAWAQQFNTETLGVYSMEPWPPGSSGSLQGESK